jgi:hypothetical protein
MSDTTWSALVPAWWAVGPTWADIFNGVRWKPDTAVLIDGADVSSNITGTITIRRGRDSVYVEPSASYASINLISVEQPLNLSIGRPLSLSIANMTGRRESLFAGRISDIDVQVTPGQQNVVRYRVTAVGPLADVNRRQVLAGGRAQELDGERALAAIFGGAAETWESFSPTLEWGDTTEAWIDFVGNVDLANFDDGVFAVAALDPAVGGYPALTTAQESAASGGGVLYETREGKIAYADAARRPTTFDAGDFKEIPGDVLDPDGMNASSALSELANRVQVEWAGGVEEAEVRESIVQFGLFERRITTILAEESDAQTRAQELAQDLALPLFKADRFRLLLNNIEGPQLDRFIGVEPNDGVTFIDLPDGLGFNRLVAFVEGIEWSIDEFTAELGLFASDERLSVGSVWWGRVNETLEWGDVDPALQWQNVERTL